MSESKPQPTHQPSDQEQLVAYLDHELDASARQQVEQRLTREASLRDQLNGLQESWDILDVLPRAAADHRQAQTTIAMVARATREEVSPAKPGKKPPIHWRRWLVPVLVGGLAFAAVSWPLHRARRQHLSDLPLAQNMELYRYAESVEFLEQLYAEGVFDTQQEDRATGGNQRVP